MRFSTFSLVLVATGVVAAPTAVAPDLLAGLHWRNLGPFRAGRVAAVSGAIGQTGTFYMGLPLGGVWKTTSAGEVWFPIFDDVKEASSVGAIEVAPPDPNVIYVGMGDLITGGGINEGNGVYKSVDAGMTWQHLGLDDTRQIPTILVDPHDANLVLLAAQGDVHKKSETRGVYRSTDCGQTWTKTLYVDDSTGMQKIAWAADHPEVILATSVRHYVTPITGPNRVPAAAAGAGGGGGGAGGGGPQTGPSQTKLFKSTDKGLTWHEIPGGSGGGTTFTGFKGAPGGDDPQQMWIDPTNGQRMLLGLDQGGVVTLDGGATWTSYYNQSTEQVYHITVDNSYPYWVYASQQDAGAIRIRSRGNLGAVTPLDWNPVSGWEWGTTIPDPLNPNVVYASGSGILKITYPSEQWINVSPNVDPTLFGRTTISQPVAFAPWNQHELIAGFQFVMATTDGGAHWTKLSGDLGYPAGAVIPPDSVRGRGAPGSPIGGAIQSLSLSTVRRGVMWAGTNNGLIKLTRDEGKTWEDVSIPNLPVPGRGDILAIEASHFDPAAAYAAVDFHATGDYKPYFFRTHDYGKTWTAIVHGLPTDQPSGSFARVIRGDTKQAGLLFAGTESGMYVSFDDGEDWQSLQLNLPNTSYRDIAIHGNDLVVGTYGRGIWVLDDYSPLRQITAATATDPVHLFAPGDAVRVRRNVGADTPFPPEVPHALNPPDGAIIYYYLASPPTGEISLDVLDAGGAVVRHLSTAPVEPVKEAAQPPEPNFWIATPQRLVTAVGTNRVNWDLRAEAPAALTHTFEINANLGLTPPSPEGPLVPPGVYSLKLIVGAKAYTQTMTVVSDPRSPARAADVRTQYDLQMKIVAGIRQSWDGYHQVAALRAAVAADTAPALPAAVVAAAKAFDSTLALVAGDPGGGRGGGGGGGGFFGGGARPAPTFVSVNGNLAGQINTLENGDMAPTPAMQAAYVAGCRDLQTVVTTWTGINAAPLATFNAVLTQNNLKPVAATGPALVAPVCSRS